MWMCDPRILCRKHLLGEHGELHKHLPAFNRGVRVEGRFYPVVQMQFKGYRKRHDALAKEMIGRGMNHRSPLPDTAFKANYPEYWDTVVDREQSLKDLIGRCSRCRERLGGLRLYDQFLREYEFFVN
jgi:hypothetical protein